MSTPLGLAIALVGVVVGGLFKGVNPVYLVTNLPAIFIVILGGLGATMSCFGMSDTTNVFKAIMRVCIPKAEISNTTRLQTIVEFATKARSEGLLSLESDVSGLEDEFMRKGLQLAIDGSDPDAVADVMRTDIRTMKARHKVGAEWCQAYGIFAPTFGIIGAVMGLIATLSHLDDPAKLGAGISAAFVATFWGVYLANGIMLPLANRMKFMSAEEVSGREMVMEGVMAIQSGQNPRVVEQTLLSYLPPAEAKALASES